MAKKMGGLAKAARRKLRKRAAGMEVRRKREFTYRVDRQPQLIKTRRITEDLGKAGGEEPFRDLLISTTVDVQLPPERLGSHQKRSVQA